MDTNPLLYGAMIVVGVAAAGYMAYRGKKQKDSSWTGVVIDKAIIENVHRGTADTRRTRPTITLFGSNNQSTIAVTHNYSVTIRPEVGESFKWDVSNGMYEQVKIGDTLSKQPGTMTPEIVGTTAAPAPAAVSTPQPVPSPTMPPPSVAPAPPAVVSQPPTDTQPQ